MCYFRFEGGVEEAIDKEFNHVKNTDILTEQICRACLSLCVILVMLQALIGMFFIKRISRWFYKWNLSVTKTVWVCKVTSSTDRKLILLLFMNCTDVTDCIKVAN